MSMSSGGEKSSSATTMEDLPSISLSQDDHSAIAASLFALTPHPSNYMMKFLSDANGEQVPILGEYFGVALAFAALGALIRETKPTPRLSPNLQRVGLQVMLKSAMDRLQALAVTAQDLEQKVKDGKKATRRGIEALEAERRTLVQKLSVAEAQVASVERSRQEDAKANERVAGMYALHEQTLFEKKKLEREVEILRDEIVGFRNRGLLQKGYGEEECEECKAKIKELEKLEDQLCEKEFLMAQAKQEARADQHERNQLAEKLAMVEFCVSDLKEKFSNEMAKNAELQEVIADVRRKHEETENKLMCAMVELDCGRREMESISAAKMNQNAIIEELLDILKSLQKDFNEKEEVIAALTKKSSTERKEKEELLHHLAQTKSKRKAAEAEKDRWKRLAEERARNMVPAGKDPHRGFRRSLGSKAEFNKMSEIQRIHSEEVYHLQSMYRSKLESLQGQLKNYEEKVTLLEAKIMVYSAQSLKRKPKHGDRSSGGKETREYVDCHEIVTLLESLVPEVDGMQFDGLGPEIQEVPMTAAALKDWLKQWLEVVKTHHAQHLEKRHCRELNAYERQMRLKGERLESFRQQLLSMDMESSNMKSKLEVLKSKMVMAVEEKSRAERAVEGKDKELRALMKTMLQNGEGSPALDAVNFDKLSHYDAQQRVLILLQKELNDARRKLEEAEAEHQKHLLKVAEETEAELRRKDHQLAVAEAKLCQLKIQIDSEKPATPNRTLGVSTPQEVAPDKVYKIAVVGSKEVNIKNALSTACDEVEKLADKIAEVRKKMMESDDNYDGGQLEELMDQAAAISNSGKKLSLLRNAISIEELNDTKVTLFRDFQTATAVQLETVSQALQKLPRENFVSAMEQETVDQPRDHLEEASNSYGTNSGAPEISEECITSTLDAEPEVNSKREQDGEAMFYLESTDSDLEEIVEERESDLRTRSSRKRERRKTLKEYFLDSPPELAVENAFQVPPVDPGATKDTPSSSRQGVLAVVKMKALANITSSQEIVNLNVTNSKSPPLFATPLLDRIKNRRREFNKTKGDIQVLGLALEVRKIEEQLFQIDRKYVSQQDVVVTPRSESTIAKITPGRLNKRYTALTGKVGQFAKQMGLTSVEKSAEMVTDNPLFNKKPSPSEILSLRQRAEVVSQSLASIEAQAAQYPGDASDVQQTGYSKDRLIDTVKTHLAQVQRSLSSRMVP